MHSTNLLVATSLRNVLGTKVELCRNLLIFYDPNLQTLAEILSEREMIGHLMENILDEATRPWGVKVERVEIKVLSSFLFCKYLLTPPHTPGRESSSTITESHGSRG